MAEIIVNKNTTTALIAGALVGAGVALLFAPQSGRRTRREVRLFAKKVGNKAEAAKLQLQHSIDTIIGDAEEKILDVMNYGKEWTDTKMTELRRALDSFGKTVAGEVDKVKAA